MKKILYIASSCFFIIACNNISTDKKDEATDNNKIILVTLDPGHFHAGLVQKEMYPGVDSNVYVYAPNGPDLQQHLKRIDAYNTRAENPTHWNEHVYTGEDFFQKMITEKKGNVVVMAGNNRKKSEYILNTIKAGMHVLGDKPMAINSDGFHLLQQAFDEATKNNVLLYDIMTERFEINTILQREFSQISELFGQMQTGTADDPAVIMESVHFLYKSVSGVTLERPSWFFDVNQEGEGVQDVGTHLVDLVQWECFPNQAIDYKQDIKVLSAKHWPTSVTLQQFKAITRQESFPEYLSANKKNDTTIDIYFNGDILYKIKGIYAKITAKWDYSAPPGSGDTHYSLLKGTKAKLFIQQTAAENYKPALYIEPIKNNPSFEESVKNAVSAIEKKYPGISVQKKGNRWKVIIPQKYITVHEQHFGEVTSHFLQYLKDKKLPDWEVPNMLAKYYTTTQAYILAQKSGGQ